MPYIIDQHCLTLIFFRKRIGAGRASFSFRFAWFRFRFDVVFFFVRKIFREDRLDGWLTDLIWI